MSAEYEADLEANLSSLLDRFKSGRYRAPPVKRVYIPKGDGKRLRPIGIPTLEDKVLQRAVVMILEPLYEQQFLDTSYGFRPGRSAHQALDALWQRIMPLAQCWLIEVARRSDGAGDLRNGEISVYLPWMGLPGELENAVPQADSFNSAWQYVGAHGRAKALGCKLVGDVIIAATGPRKFDDASFHLFAARQVGHRTHCDGDIQATTSA